MNFEVSKPKRALYSTCRFTGKLLVAGMTGLAVSAGLSAEVFLETIGKAAAPNMLPLTEADQADLELLAVAGNIDVRTLWEGTTPTQDIVD